MYSKLIEAIMVFFRVKYDKLSDTFYRVYFCNGDYTGLEINNEDKNIIFEGRVIEEYELIKLLSIL